MDSKSDKTDGKIDCLVYFFVDGLVLKGGFDFYMIKEVRKDFEGKVNYTEKK